MSTNKEIIIFQKQNDSIYSSLNSRGIHFERILIENGISDDDHLKLLKEENTNLKIKVNENKQQQPKEKKNLISVPIPEQVTIPLQLKKESKPKNNDEDDEETFEDPVKKFDTIINMEELKRAFFSKDYETFESQIKSSQLKFFNVKYQYDYEMENKLEYMAKNLLNGFIKKFDKYKKYFMICFRCWKHQYENKYKYESIWIVNTNEKISNMIGDFVDDFIFTEITDVDYFISNIKKLDNIDYDEAVFINNYTCISEEYVH